MFTFCLAILLYSKNKLSLFYALPFYLTGVFYAMHYKNFSIKTKPSVFIAVFLVTSYLTLLVGITTISAIIIEIISVLCIWFVSTSVTDNYPLNLDISFLIYETHEIVFSILFKIFLFVLPKTALFGLINWFLTLIIGFIITYIGALLIKRLNNNLYYYIGGK